MSHLKIALQLFTRLIIPVYRSRSDNFGLSMSRNANKIEGEALAKSVTCLSYRDSISIRMDMVILKIFYLPIL